MTREKTSLGARRSTSCRAACFVFSSLAPVSNRGLVQNDGEVERGAPVLLPVGNRIEVIFTTTSCGGLQQDIAVRNQVQMQGFSGRTAGQQTVARPRASSVFFIPALCRWLPEVVMGGSKVCKKDVKPHPAKTVLHFFVYTPRLFA